jgi:hypothetical protein
MRRGRRLRRVLLVGGGRGLSGIGGAPRRTMFGRPWWVVGRGGPGVVSVGLPSVAVFVGKLRDGGDGWQQLDFLADYPFSAPDWRTWELGLTSGRGAAAGKARSGAIFFRTFQFTATT